MTHATQWQVLESLAAWGLKVNPLNRRASSVEEIEEAHRELVERRDEIDYEMDGLVVKLDELAARDELGSTSHHPRWAFAFKFPPRREETVILSIVPSVGRTGVVTPVALMRPVEIGGVTVSRATLHNRDEVARKDVREGDKVRLERPATSFRGSSSGCPGRARSAGRRSACPTAAPPAPRRSSSAARSPFAPTASTARPS